MYQKKVLDKKRKIIKLANKHKTNINWYIPT